jgi:TolB protein
MTYMRTLLMTIVAGSSVLALGAAAQQPPGQQPPGQQPPGQQQEQQRQPTEITLTLTGSGGLPPKLAVPDFIALTNDPEITAAAKTMGQVLWDDLNFEREFYLIPRDTYRTIPPATSLDNVPLAQWKELGADGVIIGTVRKTGTGAAVQVRMIEVASGRSAFAKEYSGSLKNPRLYAHTASDEIHQQQRALRGVARTKLAFTSDRDGERMMGPVGDRGISNIYISDYDGANQQRVTVTRALDITPMWSPDGKAIAYTSYRTGFQDIIVSYIYEGRRTNPAAGTSEKQNFLPAWSPDGSKLAFTSNRDGNSEIYVVNRDGSGMRRLTNNPAIDVTPTWSPTGNQIAFTSDRTGTPQIWIMNADGSELRKITNESKCDRPTWSVSPNNEIAYASQTGAGFDIRIFDVASGTTRTITDGIGSNESPAFSPNGRHIAFTSTRAGKEQIFVIDRDGKNLRQITRTGMNRYPNWSQ